MPPRKEATAPLCLECGKPSVLVQSQTIYPRRPDLWNRPMWHCAPCGAYVGCHAGSDHPKGRPASKRTRGARMDAHAAFDPLWQEKAKRENIKLKDARAAGYKWLADQLGIPPAQCHIGEMGYRDAHRVESLCKVWLRRLRAQDV